MRYFVYLILSLVMQVITWFITPFLPLFATLREGWSDNHDVRAIEPRLPLWLSWFDTPDNSLFGDRSFRGAHSGDYLSQVAWLYRNSLYGFKWTVLAGPSPSTLTISGDWKKLDYHTQNYGIMWLRAGSYWQWKCVAPFGPVILVLNFGWLLEDISQPKALFMFSPRIKKG